MKCLAWTAGLRLQILPPSLRPQPPSEVSLTGSHRSLFSCPSLVFSSRERHSLWRGTPPSDPRALWAAYLLVYKRRVLMWDFIVRHWCFVPYLALLSFLAVMSALERPLADRAVPRQ